VEVAVGMRFHEKIRLVAVVRGETSGHEPSPVRIRFICGPVHVIDQKDPTAPDPKVASDAAFD
jgi:hypothetical protein